MFSSWFGKGISPFAGAVLLAGLLTSMVSADESRPAWIWVQPIHADQEKVAAAKEDRLAPEQCLIRTTWKSNFAIQVAKIRLAADYSRVTVSINGKRAFILDDYGPWTTQDITDFVIPGENQLTLQCAGSPGPSAILASLEIKGAGGELVRLQSGSSWKGRSLSPNRDHTPWRPCRTFGQVAEHLWRADDRPPAITPFDDYEQWKQALDESDVSQAPAFHIPDGYEIQLLRAANEQEGSWIGMTFDPQQRLIVAREDRGLLRMTFSDDFQTIIHVEPIPLAADLKECRGLAFLGGDLYINANQSHGLYVLRDSNRDGTFDQQELLREFPGRTGHGRNDLAAVRNRLLSIHGDAVDVPRQAIDDRTSPFREARKGDMTQEGHLLSVDPMAGDWQLLAAGLRNPFGIAVRARDGSFFTYDADAEFDMGAPWYRPTRVVHLMTGADYGWRGVTGQWPPYYPDHPDNALPVIDIGKGSPTAVKFGTKSQFPPPYREALFILDWAYGRVLAVHLIPRGLSYTARAEVFLRGRPLNVTDIEFGPDGAMYLTTGGRKTKSALYRLRRKETSKESPPPEGTELRSPNDYPAERSAQARARTMFQKIRRDSFQASQTRGETVTFHSLEQAVKQSNLKDPAEFFQEVLRIEHQLPEHRSTYWAFADSDTGKISERLAILLAFSRESRTMDQDRLLRRLNRLPFSDLSPYERLLLLRCYALVLNDDGQFSPELIQATRQHISSLYPSRLPRVIFPVGAGGPINHRLAELLVKLKADDVVAKTMHLLRGAKTQEDQLHYLHVLRHVQQGWSLEDRRDYFRVLGELDQRAHGGRGMPGFLKTIRDEAIGTLTPDENKALKDQIQPQTEVVPLRSARPVIHDWKLEDMEELLSAKGVSGSWEQGRKLFDEALCSRCHRVHGHGRSVGPDLSSIGQRFSSRDILRSILDPSDVVAEPYRNVEIVTEQGKTYIGQVLHRGDYRQTSVQIQTDPLQPAQVTVIPKKEILLYRDAKTSPMPQGLLNVLTKQEIVDLLEFLRKSPARR